MANDLADLQRQYRQFVDDRDWRQFHDPKSLVLALVGEVGELAELFQWIPADNAQELFSTGSKKQRAGEEMSDVLLYLLALADSLGVDIVTVALEKLSEAGQRYPTSDFLGGAPEKH